MEDHYIEIPKEAQEFNKEFPTSKSKFTISQIVIAVLIVSLIISIGYIITELPEQDIELVRNESLILGFNAGVEQWNTQVISKVNNNGTIPYYYNQTYYELNIAQLCSGVQDG